MKRLALLALSSSMIMFAACGSDDAASTDSAVTTDSASDSGSTPCLQANQGEPADEYVGLTSADAEALAAESNLVFRVVGTDGECLALTMDVREDRVNVEIVDGKVSGAARF